ncbi:MAG: substrate-binding domain-containing protein [Phototrophicaceae bacterium]
MRRFILLLTCMLFVLPALAQQQLPPVDPATVSGDMIISGSPILESVTSNLVTRFTLEGYTGSITLSSNDTATSFQQLCRGDVDIVMADRSILPQELDACTAASRPPIGFRVATSAVIVAVSNQNQFASNLSSIQLQQIFSSALAWSDVNPAWTSEAISRFGPPIDSAPFNLFVTTVYGGNRTPLVTAIGSQYIADPGARLQSIVTSSTAIGFFDAGYALNNANVLTGVTLDGIAPTITTVADNTYPLSRPLLLYTTSQDFTQDPQVASFINYYLSNVATEASNEGLIPAPQAAQDTARNRWLSASGQNAPAPQPTQVVTVVATAEPIADISATATALANVVGDEPITPEPVATSIFDVETQNILLQARLDLELTADEVLGTTRPVGWSGSIDIEDRQLPLLIRLDMEVLAAQIYGIENRPDGWFGAVSSTQEAISRDIRHDLELMADDVFGNERPVIWVGSEPIYRCDRSTQALADLLSKNGLYTLTADPLSPNYCMQVALEISRFVEVNLLASSPIGIGSEGVSIPAEVTIETTIAVGFYNRSASQRAGLIPNGTGIVPVARSYQGFSNMTLIEGDGFLLFVEWQNTSLTQAEWRSLPDEADFEFEPACSQLWCDVQG